MRQKVKQIVNPNKYSVNQDVPLMDEDKTVRLRRLLSDLYPDNWGTAKDADEMAYDIKIQLSDLGYESGLSCKDIDYIRISQAIKVGSKKYVDRAILRPQNTEVVIKSQGNDQETKIKCMKRVYDADKCHNMGNYHLMREILLLSILKHPGIVNLIGFCIRGDSINYDIKKKGLLLVLEAGTPVTPGILSYTQWDTRMRFAIQLAEMLKYLEESPLGSVELLGIRMDDFVTTRENKLKLVDLDDVNLDEKTCQSDADCKIPTASLAHISCESGRCKDWNAKNNMQRVGALLFNELLSNPPSAISRGINELKQSIMLLNITANQIIPKLKGMQTETAQVGVGYDANEGQGHVKVEMSGDYQRIEQSNFPGQYDYTCQSSRVLWGCVITVHSLGEAKNFSLMTMVAKNSGTGKPQPNVGATLFIRSAASVQGVPVNAVNTQTTASAEMMVSECRARTWNANTEARISRERRLMTHLGLKGVSEDNWKLKVKMSRITRHTGVDKFQLTSTVGARFEVELANLEKPMKRAVFLYEKGPSQYHIAHLLQYQLDRILGLYQTPPTVVWPLTVADMADVSGDKIWAETLGPLLGNKDEIKGLLTFPVPSNVKAENFTLVNKTSIANNVTHFNKSEKSQLEHVFLRTLCKSGLKQLVTNKGLLTTSMPRVIQEGELQIKRRSSMTKEVVQFSRTQKMQLEYTFLWFLAKVALEKDTHYGYKGHFIHFMADGAFQDLNINLLGYFNNCQFPNVVYKALTCFKCSSKGSQICSLGHEAMQRILSHGFTNRDIKIQDLTPNELSTIINDAATSVMSIVDTCIKNFGRDKVLY
uniref:Uncharacterized protein n=1 Tax=Magallana gigas TaxID=29159 RepID=K1Q7J8_MAGGI